MWLGSAAESIEHRQKLRFEKGEAIVLLNIKGASTTLLLSRKARLCHMSDWKKRLLEKLKKNVCLKDPEELGDNQQKALF